MSLLPKSGILFSNEDFDADEPIEVTEVTETPEELEVQSAEDESELVETNDTLNQGEEQIDSAETAVDGLETIADKVEEMNEDGEEGIDEPTAELVETAVESILQTARIGVSVKKIGIPSTESFSNKAKRKELGQATVEGIRETAKKIWQAIINAIQKSIEWIRQLFTKIFYSADRMKKRATALLEKAEKVEGDAKEKEINDFSLLKSVSVRTNVADVSDLKHTTKIISDVLDYQKKMVNVNKKASDELATENTKTGIIESITEVLKTTSNVVSSNNFLKKAPDNIRKQITGDADVTVHASDPTVGNDVYYVINGDVKSNQTGSAEGIIKFCNNTKAGVIKAAYDIKSDSKLAALGKAKMIDFLKGVQSLADVILEYKSLAKDIDDAKKNFLDLAKNKHKNQENAEAKIDELTRAILGRLRKISDEPARSASVYGVRSGYAILSYVSKSLALYPKS